MKKLIALLLFTTICNLTKSQNHFTGTYYIDAAAGISDQSAVEPSLGGGYNFNDVFSVNTRYAFKTPAVEDQYRFFEHTLDIYAKYTVYNYREMICLNFFGGVSQSINKYSEMPRPTFTPRIYNVGHIVGVELEYLLNSNMTFFSSINNRGFYLDDKTHLEITYQIGVRVDYTLFSKQIYHPRNR